MSGWIKLHRQITEWEWYKNIPCRVLFVHCLFKANIEPKKWQGLEIKVGQFVTSLENLAFETGLSIMQVRTALKKLKSTGEITNKTTSRYSIITINNWEQYQTNNTQDNKQITNEQQTDNKQITTTKEYKEYKEYKKQRIDIFASEEVEKIFKIYEENCPNLCKLSFERKIKPIRDLIGDFLTTTDGNLELFKNVCIKANELKEIAGNRIDLKSILNNYAGILSDKYKKPNNKHSELSRDRILELMKGT